MNIHKLSQKAAATLVGQAPRTLRDWDASGEGPPRNSDGTYPGPALVAWFVARSGGDELDANRERARKDKEMADKLALENAVRRGELLEADEVSDMVGAMVANARSRLIQLPDALGQFCDAKSAPIVTAASRRVVHEALTELAATDFGDVGAAADADGERVGGHESAAVGGGERGAGAVAN